MQLKYFSNSRSLFFTGPSEQVIDRNPEENVKIKKRRTGKKWVALRIGMKVGKTSLKVADHVADSGVVEQLSCLDSCIAAIPCGMLFCCLCKFGCAFWKARDAFKEHYGQLPCYGKGPCKKGGLFEKCPCAGEVLEEVIDAAAGGDDGDTDLATDVVMGVSEEAADAADKTSVTSSISTFSMPEWCNNAYQGCRGCLGKMKAGMSQG